VSSWARIFALQTTQEEPLRPVEPPLSGWRPIVGVVRLGVLVGIGDTLGSAQ
jgi:hypothetical protein